MSYEHVPQSSTVYTPLELASAMVSAARGRPNSLWLDPCVGDGAFVSQMAKQGVPAKQILAVDIAPHVGALDHAAQTVRGIDFLEWAVQHHSAVDHVVMNPPYAALSRVREELLERALEVRLSDGQCLPFKANYWAAFLLAAVTCVRGGGSLVAVLPAAWDFAKYASRVRETVGRAFGEVFVVRCGSPLFPKVQEGVVVIVAFNRGGTACINRRVEVPTLVETIASLEQIAQGKVPHGTSTLRAFAPPPLELQRLDALIHIGIGAVTGDAGYFLLNEAERSEWRLPQSALRPALSRSRHLTSATIGIKEWRALRDQGARVWMFRPTEAVLQHNAVKAYLKHGREGGCNVAAYWINKRDPWHRTSLPARIDGFMSGMSKRLPFLVLRKMQGLTASNTLYVIRFKKHATEAEKAKLGVLLLTSSVRAELARHARIYADGLLKFEPADLGAVRVPVVQARKDATRVLLEATALLLSGREAEASAMADEWVTSATVTTANESQVIAERSAVA
ncbi:MAG: class I SAM-dependent methyltransferase [Deltaproteobacteria bacterium]|nr:class I SAM-dependent methyltransferase [Myxococcales bacterium]MDP3218128.1 class I SAM-dependent methyltransferase [Deltaproteobacteria bacterium]